MLAQSVLVSDGSARTLERAWDAELGCTCGAGMPCECNSADEPDTSEVIFEETDIHAALTAIT
jgi:hypothetical protein